MNGAIVLIGVGKAVALSIMAAVWLVSVRIRNAGIVDVAWSALFAMLASIYALLAHGDPVRRFAAAGMMVFWSVRLAWHLGRRVLGHLETEDPRYASLRAKWGRGANRNMLFFFLFQGVTNVLLSVPVLLAAMNARPGLRVVEYAGIALWLVALIGESEADAQLARFRRNPANRGHVCTDGLWGYSRHPNYFFEWLIWCAFFLFALGSPWGWVAAYCPVLMLWFLYKVTGIPATEAHSLLTKGEEYRRYQRTTSAFVPWLRKG
ncbi:MAG: DUF1295 domain-containing protein [Acidobacteriota bacterium]